MPMKLALDFCIFSFHVYCSIFRLFACESMTMAKHPVQAVPCVYCPPAPNYIVTRDYKRSITQLLAQQCLVNSNIHNKLI